MKILVTGGAGFIGSNLVHYLLELQGEVMVVDDLSTGIADNLDPRAGFRKVDICDDEFLAVAKDFDPDVIVHLAAQSSVAVGNTNPELTRRVNLDGTGRVIDAAVACDCERIVFASSASVYGNPDTLPLVEAMPFAAISLYGETKAEGEKMIRAGLAGTRVDYALLRFGNVYGPRQNAHGEAGVIAIFCGNLLEGKTPMIEGDGQQTRDFVYVADVVNALVSAIGGDITFAQDFDADGSGAYNIATGQPSSVEQVLNGLRAAAEFYGVPTYGPARPGDPKESVLSTTKAFEVFEFKANVALEKGLEATWMWYEAHK